MAQAKEGIYLFTNQGAGTFSEVPLVEFQPLFGSTYFELADLNGDGFLDIRATNGDNGEYPSPFKNYHGIRIYLNDGKNQFHEAWFYPMNGAFQSGRGDFDNDGDLDIAAISFFPDFEKSPEESFVYLENKGGMKFEASSFPQCISGRWLTMDVGDFDGDGDLDIVLGSFAQGPPSGSRFPFHCRIVGGPTEFPRWFWRISCVEHRLDSHRRRALKVTVTRSDGREWGGSA